MSNPTVSLYSTTPNDIQLALAYFPILVDLAKQKENVEYGKLVAMAKAKYPNNPVVQRAIAVSTGRKLAVVRSFTDDRGLPDITSLVVNRNSGECGDGFTDYFDPEHARKKVFDFDWSKVSSDFDKFTKRPETIITPRKQMKEQEAVEIMAQFYQKNKEQLPSSVRQKRDLIIELLIEGLTPENAFSQAINAK